MVLTDYAQKLSELCFKLLYIHDHFKSKIISPHLVISTWLRATSHTRLKAHDHCNLRALIGRKGGDRPSSLHTRRWRPKGPKKTSWMKSLHGVLHDRLWIRFHGLPEFSSGLPPRGGPHTTFRRPHSKEINIYIYNQHEKFQGRFQNKFHDKQTPPSSSFKLIEFETYYIKPNPHLFSRQQNMQWSCNMFHSHFTLRLRARNYIKPLSQHPW